jgi:hypothetical protein
MAQTRFQGPVKSDHGFRFGLQSNGGLQVGDMAWNTNDGTIDVQLTPNVTMQVGKEIFYRIKNQSGSDIADGDAVEFAGALGNSGVLLGTKAQAAANKPPAYFMGVATENIPDGAFGLVTHFGLVRGIDTRGGAENWADGDLLYLSGTTAGKLTNVPPTAPVPKILVSAVVFRSPNGSMFVRPTIGENLSALHDVQITNPQAGDVLKYDAVNQRWFNTQP